ncbi:MAG: phenylalanine--tRNA ligase subunit beta, partial [Rhodothermales bacterium]
RFTTLDSKARLLPSGTLMICDAERDVAIAGVMGGENSEVTSATRNVLIESAYFDPTSIRKTAKALGLQTDASYRFERGVDRDGQVWAAARAAHLIADLAGGSIVHGMVDAHPVPLERRRVMLRNSRVKKLLGVDIPIDRTAALLESIGFEVAGATNHEPVLTCTVPTFRPDVEREVDLIEEVVRLFGYENISEPERSVAPALVPRERAVDRLRGSARSLLSSSGYREIYTNSMQRTETARTFLAAGGGIVETLNPISQEMAALRPSLLPGALQVMGFNRKHGQKYLRFFELGHIYGKSNESKMLIPGYEEHESLIVAASGPATVRGWDVGERTIDLFDLKGVIETLLSSIRTPALRFEQRAESGTSSSHQLGIYSGETHLGILARVSEDVADSFDLKEPVLFAELNWDTVVSLAAPGLERRYHSVSRFPIVERDIAVVVDGGEPAGRLMETILTTGGALLKHADIFDLFEGEHIGAGKKSVAFSLRFGADRTLTDREVDSRVADIVTMLEKLHGAALRG